MCLCLCVCVQVRTLASAGGPGNLVMLDPAKYKSRPRCSEHVEGSTHPKWLVGEQEFEAYMRMLDNLVGINLLVLRVMIPFHRLVPDLFVVLPSPMVIAKCCLTVGVGKTVQTDMRLPG
jgi:hypothetical protein